MSITLLLAAALAFALGAVTALLMRVAGLGLLIVILGGTAIFRMALGYPHPTWAELGLVLVTLQLGYAAAALGPWADGRVALHKRLRARNLAPKDKTP
jgi:uncharacterized membrane protein YbhN (UPF0104 family)